MKLVNVYKWMYNTIEITIHFHEIWQRQLWSLKGWIVITLVISWLFMYHHHQESRSDKTPAKLMTFASAWGSRLQETAGEWTPLHPHRWCWGRKGQQLQDPLFAHLRGPVLDTTHETHYKSYKSLFQCTIIYHYGKHFVTFHACLVRQQGFSWPNHSEESFHVNTRIWQDKEIEIKMLSCTFFDSH